MTKSTNPLMMYKPHPKVHVKLPTMGVFYKEGVVDLSDHEIGICAMSAKDEMALNNPEALMNGRAITAVIENCVDAIKDAGELAASDIEVLLLGIRLASGNKSYEVGGICPECGQKGVFERDIDAVLAAVEHVQEEPVEVLDTGLIVHLKPNTWKSHSNIQQMAFQRQRLVAVAQDDEMDMETRKQIFQEVFDGMIEINMLLIADSINYIETPEGNVDNPQFIREYIEMLDKNTIKSMSAKIEELNSIGAPHEMDVVCSNPECNHEWTLDGLRYDPSHFFAQSSSIAR